MSAVTNWMRRTSFVRFREIEVANAERVRRHWRVVVVCWLSMLVAGSLAILLDHELIGAGLIVGSSLLTLGWNEWIRRRGLKPPGPAAP